MNLLAGRALPSPWRSPAAVITTAAAALLASIAVSPGVAAAAPTDPILVFSGNSSMAPSQTYSAVGTVSGRPISSTTVMPSSLTGNACVLLNLNQAAFNTTQVTTLSSYLSGGGRVVMIGENDNYVNNAAFRGLATSLGSSMQIQNDALDGGFRDTLNIDADPLTRDVTAITYAATASVTFSSPARSLVRTSGGGATMIAAEAMGDGQLIALGDANAFTAAGGSNGAGRLVANICGSRRATTSAVDCDPASSLLGTPVTCTVTATDSDTGTAVTPTGRVLFTRSGAGAGTFADGGECGLVPTGTLGEASCTVTYTTTEAGAQTLTGAYEGTNQSFSSAGSDTHTATLPAPPVATGGSGTAPFGEAQTFQVAIPAGSTLTLLDDGQPAVSVAFAGEGVYSLDADTGVITFTSAEGFSGTARAVSFRLTDGYGQTSDASFVATVSAAPQEPAAPTPTPTPTPLPPAAPTSAPTLASPVAPTPAATPAPAPAAARAVCASRRVMRVNFRVPARAKVRRMRVTVAGKVRRVSVRTRRVTVDLRGMGPRGVRVVLTATVAGGRTLKAVRSYRTCAKAHTVSTPGTLYLRSARRN